MSKGKGALAPLVAATGAAGEIERVDHLIAGQLVPSHSGEYLDSIDPSNEELCGVVAAGDSHDVERAVAAAGSAFATWSATPVAERCRYLLRLAERVELDAERFALIECRDVGNPLAKAKGDAVNAASAIRYFVGLAEHLAGEAIPLSASSLHFTTRIPFGVVGRIIPFNHPLTFAASKLAAPLVAGNTVVLKPPEQDSVSMGLFGRICADLLPAGVVNIVTGTGAAVGEPLVRHPSVRRIAFTGSLRTGLRVMESAAASGHLKVITLELGGKNPFVVLPDADPVKVASAAVEGMSFNWQGQSCGSTSRLIVHQSLHDEVASLVADRVQTLRLGPPADPATDIGPLVSAAQLDKVCAMVERARESGANVLAGAQRPSGRGFSRGYWYEPTVLDDVAPELEIAKEEVFGPVLSIIAFHTTEEALAIANGLDYGLTAAVFGERLEDALAVAERVEAGYVWVNSVGAKPLGLPYGGIKDSGIGRESSAEELLSFTQVKSTSVRLR